MKKKKITKFIFIVLILCISIGFAILTTNLGVNANLSFKENTFDVHFENIETLDTSTVTNPTSTITDPTSISFNGTFNKPGDYIEFSFYIVNNGTINAQLNSITTNLTTDQQNYIEYNYKYGLDNSDVNINDYLYIGQSRKIIARFTYKEDIDQFINLESLNLNLNMKFIQPETVETTLWNYEYSGTEQYFVAPKSGTYKLETWGAQGGDTSMVSEGQKYSATGGYGGYSSGTININKNQKLYINTGGKGQGDFELHSKKLAGGYNGGGIGQSGSVDVSSGGGGATHLAFRSGELKTLSNNKEDIIMVAGGGGGSGIHIYKSTNNGGAGGGYIGQNGGGGTSGSINGAYGTGGTQTAGGANSADSHLMPAGFGFGCGYNNDYRNVGGGGGYYGGGCGFSAAGPGGGGSGYIGNPNLTNKIMYCYNCQESTSEADETNIKTRSTTNVSETPTSQYAKIGNGYARITYIG